MELPEEIGIMALPDAVLFPGVLLPLYIFEPRYRKLLAACLAGERMMAVGLLRKGWEREGAAPVPYPVAGVGLIRTCIGQPDGTSHLVLQGLMRVRLSHYEGVHPQLGYPVARIEALASLETGVGLPREPLVGAVKKLVKARARLGVALPKEVMASLLSLESTELLADVISYTLLDDSHEKQVILETLDVPERLAKLDGLLHKQIAQFELWKRLQGRLLNKNVGHN